MDYLCPRSGQGQNQLLCGENNLLIGVLETCIIELITSHLDSLLFILPRFAVLKVHKSETMGGKNQLFLCVSTCLSCPEYRKHSGFVSPTQIVTTVSLLQEELTFT